MPDRRHPFHAGPALGILIVKVDFNLMMIAELRIALPIHGGNTFALERHDVTFGRQIGTRRLSDE